MNLIHHVDGDLLTHNAQYIAHQCNCISKTAAHLANSIFKKFPYADEYSNRTKNSEPGTISIRGNGQDERLVISMFSQYYPGRSKYNTGIDTLEKRKSYFHISLKEILKINNLTSIAFPSYIGCGAAGGDWDFYRNLLEKFAQAIPKTNVYIIKKD